MKLQAAGFISGALMLALASGGALAQQTATTQVNAVQVAPAQARETQNAYSKLNEHDKVLAQLWDLTDEEILRAKVLLEGPRKSFSVPNISPVEALGIHARSEAERAKYAEKFARTFHQDVERSLAWNNAFYAAMARLYPNEPVVSSAGIAPVQAPVGAADALGVPRSLVIEPGASTPVQVEPANPMPVKAKR